MASTQAEPVDRTFSAGLAPLEHRYTLSWADLSHTVALRGGVSKTVLHASSGTCNPGEMMALMGPSGSGKTTLLDLLGNRVSSGDTKGKVCIGGVERNTRTSRKIVSYVMQEDALLSCFTTRETLGYTARLVLPASSNSARQKRITAVMEQMGLTSCADTRVGDPLIKGLSGGQKRRLSIAIELLSGSPILLLDEPTSGLDSTAAHQVVEHLNGVAAKGHAVVMSIHQPSSATFSTFTSFCLLAKGRQIYLGPTGDEAIQHFAAIGHRCPEYTNPAEYFVDLVNTDFRKGFGEDQLEHMAQACAASEAAFRMSAQRVKDQDPESYMKSRSGGAGFLRQFVVLLHRTVNMSWKNPYIFAVRLVMYVALAVMVGTMYWKVGEVARTDSGVTGQAAAESLLPCLFYVQAFLVFMAVAILPFFLEIRDVFRRERANGQIDSLPYVLADFFANLPGVTLIAIISTMLVVWLADLNGFEQFFLNLWLSLIIAESLMHVIGAAQPHYIIGMAFGAGLFGMFMLCEGFMVPYPDIPDSWKWGYYIAFHSYSFEWFVYNQFSGEDGGAFGQAILEKYDMEDVDPVKNAMILGGYAVLFEALFFLVLKIFHTGKR